MSEAFWTAERVAELRERVTAGETYQAIGTSWGVSKNVPLSKANQLGIVHPNTIAATRGSEAEGRTTAQRLDRIDLFPERGTCLFPIGNPGEDGLRFCGCGIPIPASPYCREHLRIAYTPSKASVASAAGWSQERRLRQAVIARKNLAARGGR